MNITFSDESEAHYTVCSALDGFIISLAFKPGVAPMDADTARRVYLYGSDDNGVTVCEVDTAGVPQTNSTIHVTYDEIDTLTVL